MLAAATGVADPVAAVAATRVVAAAYHPGTDAAGADEALAALLALLPPDEPEALAQHVALLVQACEATAGLVRGDDLPGEDHEARHCGRDDRRRRSDRPAVR